MSNSFATPWTEESSVLIEIFASIACSPSVHQNGLCSLTEFSAPVAKSGQFFPPPLLSCLTAVLTRFKGNIMLGVPGGSDGKESACSTGDPSSIPWLGRSPGKGNRKPLRYSCLGNPMDRGAWWATVHRIAESDTTEGLTLLSCGYFFTLLDKYQPM